MYKYMIHNDVSSSITMFFFSRHWITSWRKWKQSEPKFNKNNKYISKMVNTHKKKGTLLLRAFWKTTMGTNGISPGKLFFNWLTKKTGVLSTLFRSWVWWRVAHSNRKYLVNKQKRNSIHRKWEPLQQRKERWHKAKLMFYKRNLVQH